MKYTITIGGTGETFPCDEHQTVLAGMVRLGRRGIPSGCHGGGCGVCKVQVLDGDYTSKTMSSNHVSREDAENQRVLACCIFPRSDLTVAVIGKMVKAWTIEPQPCQSVGTSPAKTASHT